MARQFSTTVRTAMVEPYETAIGTAPKLRFYTGAQPANCATVASGTLLAELTLPSDWMTAAASGLKSMLGSWTGVGLAAAGAGTNIGYFRIYDSTGATCHDQGSVTVTGGGGDMTVVNVNLAQAQSVTVSQFDLTQGGA